MQTAREQTYYPLPDDLGKIVRLAVDERERCGSWTAIWIIPPKEMARLRAESDALGRPTCAAIMLKDMAHMLVFHPTPDDTYNIDAVYEPRPKTF